MDMQATPPTYTPGSAPRPPSGNPPVLGAQVPGTSGGLPTQSGLSVTSNPMAKQLQSMGRGEDTMLVHMTPNEVNSLQGLAMAHGGSLTINPHTGLPEAGWLGKLLPTILGAIATPLTGGLINPLTASALIGAGTAAVTGDLGKGLMAGLSAYGGASLGGALGLNAGSFGIGQAANAASAALPTAATGAATGAGAASGVSPLASNLGSVSLTGGANTIGANLAGQGLASLPANVGALASTGASQAAQALAQPTGLFGKFAAAAKAGLPAGTPGIIRTAAPALAGMGLMQGISGAMTPGIKTADGKIDNSYSGPYTAQPRTASFAPSTQDLLSSSKERRYFDVDVPEIRNVSGQLVQPGTSTAPGTALLQNVLNPQAKKNEPMYMQQLVPHMGAGYAKGGEIELADGAFVVDARTVSELGNGSSGAGQELLARMGGRAVHGPGDGVSDSVPARIGHDQPARVARDEVIFSPEAVRRLGGGSANKGANKLYSLMDKAHKARKKSERGKDTKLRKGIA